MSKNIAKFRAGLDRLGQEDFKDKMIAILGSDEKREIFYGQLHNLLSDDNILKCDEKSVFLSALKAAELRLPLTKELGRVYLVPREITIKDASGRDGKEWRATFLVGYKGWIEIAARCGIRIDTMPVYDCDEFNEGYTLERGYFFDIKINREERKETDANFVNDHMRGIVVRVVDNGHASCEFVSIDLIKKLSDQSTALKYSRRFGKPNNFYDNWTLEMYKARAIKYVITRLPIGSIENQMSKAQVYEAEYEAVAGDDDRIVEKPPLKSLKEKLSEVPVIEQKEVDNFLAEYDADEKEPVVIETTAADYKKMSEGE